MNFFDDIDTYGSKTAIIDEKSECYSYTDLINRDDAVRSRIPQRCIVFSVCENQLESVAGYIGFLRGRIVPVLVNATLPADLFDKLLKTYRPAYIWMPSPKSESRNWGEPIYRSAHYVLLKTVYGNDVPVHSDLALLMMTSGSTGSPLLVRQSYGNICSNTNAIVSYLRITETDRPITTLPMSYTYGLSVLNTHLLKGCTVILTAKSVMEKAFWDGLKNHNATTFGGVPYTYEMLKILRFSNMNLPNLKILTQAGGRLSHDLTLEFASICAKKGIEFVVMYGQTEATARMSYLPSEYNIEKAGSIGIAIPGGEMWLEDANGQVISQNDTVGELVYKGPNVTMGYATNYQDLSKGDINKGVLKTGDFAKRDKDGFYYIVGRKKRFLKIFGNRVNLEELEGAIKTLGLNCVCGGKDDHLRIYTVDKGQENKIKEFVVSQTGLHPSACAVILVDSIPRSETGKILYASLT